MKSNIWNSRHLACLLEYVNIIKETTKALALFGCSPILGGKVSLQSI